MSNYSSLLGVSHMPHLTPIRWLLAIITVWTLITMININQWRTKPIKFTKINNKTNKNQTKANWFWS